MNVICRYESGIFYPNSKTAVQYSNTVLQRFQITDSNYYESCSDNEFNPELLKHINDYVDLIPGKPFPEYLGIKLIFGNYFTADGCLSRADLHNRTLDELQKMLHNQLWSCATVLSETAKTKCGMRQLENLQRGYRDMVAKVVDNIAKIEFTIKYEREIDYVN